MHRPTRDIDLRTHAPLDEALATLRGELTHSSTPDQFTFELGATVSEMQGAPGGAIRISVIARLAGATFAQFHVDLSSGDAVVGQPDIMVGSDLLGFTGIAPVRFPVYPVAQHLAEKLHAYTLPRDHENTRAKDLVDLAALAALESVDGARLLASVQATFDVRATHTPPVQLPRPPMRWSSAFLALLAESPGLPATNLQEGYELAATFWNPALTGDVRAMGWTPAGRRWVAN